MPNPPKLCWLESVRQQKGKSYKIFQVKFVLLLEDNTKQTCVFEVDPQQLRKINKLEKDSHSLAFEYARKVGESQITKEGIMPKLGEILGRTVVNQIKEQDYVPYCKHTKKISDRCAHHCRPSKQFLAFQRQLNKKKPDSVDRFITAVFQPVTK